VEHEMVIMNMGWRWLYCLLVTCCGHEGTPSSRNESASEEWSERLRPAAAPAAYSSDAAPSPSAPSSASSGRL
jgi:hypothetical protein